MIRSFVLAGVILVACRGSSKRSEPPAPSQRTAELRAALLRCHSAVQSIDHGLVPASEDMATYADGCKDLYRAPACHDVVARLASLQPPARLPALLSACSVAYCTWLPAPAPRACSTSIPELGPDLAPSWQELDAQILWLEVGHDDTYASDVDELAGIMFNHL